MGLLLGMLLFSNCDYYKGHEILSQPRSIPFNLIIYQNPPHNNKNGSETVFSWTSLEQ
jgi:hypothetical protein